MLGGAAEVKLFIKGVQFLRVLMPPLKQMQHSMRTSCTAHLSVNAAGQLAGQQGDGRALHVGLIRLHLLLARQRGSEQAPLCSSWAKVGNHPNMAAQLTPPNPLALAPHISKQAHSLLCLWGTTETCRRTPAAPVAASCPPAGMTEVQREGSMTSDLLGAVNRSAAGRVCTHI